jgi:hypothetical protein
MLIMMAILVLVSAVLAAPAGPGDPGHDLQRLAAETRACPGSPPACATRKDT